MDKIIFGIPTHRVARKETLEYAALILQEFPEKGKGFKMQLSDPAVTLMAFEEGIKPQIAVATLGKDTYLTKVAVDMVEKIPKGDICAVYADSSLSNKRLYMYLAKIFDLNTKVKNTLTLEQVSVDSGVPGIAPVIMFKLLLEVPEDISDVFDLDDLAPEILGEDPIEASEPQDEGPSQDTAQATQANQPEVDADTRTDDTDF